MSGNVMVVEDDEDIVECIRLLLESEGYRVKAAPNGRVALDMLARADPLPSVILLDIMMPRMNGFEFRAAQLADPRLAEVPVVLMTADAHLAEKTTRLTAAGAVGKPFDIGELLDLVARFAR